MRSARLPASLLLVLAIPMGCVDGGSEGSTSESSLELLSQPLWIERDAYDASHHLMVPMHASFAKGNPLGIEPYAIFFRWFQETGVPALVPDRLDRLHFVYFYTRFVALLAERESCSARSLSHYRTAVSLWMPIVEAPAWQWDRADFASVFDRVRWKLEQSDVAYSYYRAIIDEDLFALAVGADLSAVASRCGQVAEPHYAESLALARAIYSQELSATAAGGWVFQKGAWTDHPDYAYAGNAQLAPDLQPAPVSGISPDSSHSFRLPLFLVSFACAEQPGSAAREFYVELSRQLAVQWRARTVAMPDSSFRGARMTNFMDGENGVYRYGYPTQGPGAGFGPYQLSGSFNIGWWSFLGSTAEPVYRAQRESLPFADEVMTTYVGPNTTRTRHPAFTRPGFYQGTLIGEILDAAIHVATQDWCP